MNKLLSEVKQPSELTELSTLTPYSSINQKRIPYVEVEILVRSEPRRIGWLQKGKTRK